MPTNGFDFLKEGCQITGAEWAAFIERESGRWQFRASHQLGKQRKEALAAYITTASTDAWLCGSLTGGHMRSRTSVPLEGMGKLHLFVYPISG